MNGNWRKKQHTSKTIPSTNTSSLSSKPTLTVESNINTLFFESKTKATPIVAIQTNVTTLSIPSEIHQSKTEQSQIGISRSTVEEEQKIVEILNMVDIHQETSDSDNNDNIDDIEARFNRLQASIAMDSLKNHWKSKYGGTTQCESITTNNEKSTTKANKSENKQVKNKKKISQNNKSIKTVDSLKNMEIDYNWNGHYYYESKETQSPPAVSAQSTSQPCGNNPQSAIIDDNFSLLYFILMIVYLIYYQITNINDVNASTETSELFNKLNKIDNQVSKIEEAIIHMKNSFNMMVETCNDNIEQKNDKYSNVLPNDQLSDMNNDFDDTDYGASNHEQTPVSPIRSSNSNIIMDSMDDYTATATANDAVTTQNTIPTDSIDSEIKIPSDTNNYNIKQLLKMTAVESNPIDIYSLHLQNSNSIELKTFSNYFLLKIDEIIVEMQGSTKQTNIKPDYYLNKLEKDCCINAKNDPSFETISSVAASSKILQSKLPSVYHRSRYKLI